MGRGSGVNCLKSCILAYSWHLIIILKNSEFLKAHHSHCYKSTLVTITFIFLNEYIPGMFYKTTGPSQVTLAVRLINGGDQCTQRKPLTNFITISSTPRHEWDLNSQL